MPNKIFNIRLRNKRDTEANWEKKNPLILDGEIIVVTTTSGETRVKIGDGVKTYTQLPFLDDVSVDIPIATSSTAAQLKLATACPSPLTALCLSRLQHIILALPIQLTHLEQTAIYT